MSLALFNVTDHAKTSDVDLQLKLFCPSAQFDITIGRTPPSNKIRIFLNNLSDIGAPLPTSA